MRRDGPNTFKGSIFVEFATQEMADDFLKQELKIGETVLEKMTRYLPLTSIFPGFFESFKILFYYEGENVQFVQSDSLFA